jgi:hypothetical protein
VTAIDGPGPVKVLTLTGTVPRGAVQGFANLNYLRQTGGNGQVEMAVYDVTYREGSETTQRVPNGNFAQGLEGWAGQGNANVRLSKSDRGAGSMLQITAAPGQTGFRSSGRFRVTPGARFTATFTASVSASAADAGFLGINFVDGSGQTVSRETLLFRAPEVRADLKADDNGAFKFDFGDLRATRLSLEARYDGDPRLWSAFLRRTVAVR